MLVLTGLGLLAVALFPSDEALAAQAADRLGSALGVKVSVGALHWHLLPVASIRLENVVIAQARPLSFRQLTLYPDLHLLWTRRIRIDRAELQGALIPQLSLRGLGKTPDEEAKDSSFVPDEFPLRQLVFRDVTWVSRRGIPVIYEGEVDFDTAWRPRTAALRRPGLRPATDLALSRLGSEERWSVRINVGGGTLNGSAQLQTLANGRLHLEGQLQPRNIEISAALEAFNRRAALAGKASGTTRFSADGDTAFELARSLRTSTPFTMGRSTLLHFDLDKAIRTVGREHAGQTSLDGISGRLDTQNSADGMVLRFIDVAAKSGALSASGNARLFNQQIDSEFAVDLIDGLVGVPLKVSGPVSSVKVSVPGGALAGAAVGTAILPGIGTAIGARLGSAIGKVFGSGGAESKSSPAPAPKAPRQGGPAGARSP